MWFEIGVFLLIVIGIVTYYYFKNYHKVRGRATGGLYCLFAPPGEGKSYILTALVIEFMKAGRKVYTNFPVVYFKRTVWDWVFGRKGETLQPDYVSFFWEREMMHENVNGSVIVVDEAYRDYSSRFYQAFTRDDHTWFATTGHNEISMYVATQNPARLDIIIREIINIWMFVKKVEIPFLNVPLYFNVEYYTNETDMNMSKYGMVDPWYKERFWFKKKIAQSYDTKFFKKEEKEPFKGMDWITYYEKRGYEFKPYFDVNEDLIKWLCKQKTILIKENKIIEQWRNRKSVGFVGIERFKKKVEGLREWLKGKYERFCEWGREDVRLTKEENKRFEDDEKRLKGILERMRGSKK